MQWHIPTQTYHKIKSPKVQTTDHATHASLWNQVAAMPHEHVDTSPLTVAQASQPTVLINIDVLGRLDLRPSVLRPLAMGSALPEHCAVRSRWSCS
jgi:hypothetical protein